MTFQKCILVILLSEAVLAQGGDWEALVNRGRQVELAGNYGAAAGFYRDATQTSEQFDPTDSRRLIARVYLATAYDQRGRVSDAEREYRAALRIAEKAGGKTNSGYAMVLGNLASLYADVGQTERGERLMRESVAIQSTIAMPDDVGLAVARKQLAEILLRPGKFTEAEQLLNAALAVLQLSPAASRQTAAVLNDLGIVHQERGRDTRAEDLFRQSIAMVEREFGPEHPLLLRPLNNLATLCDRKGRADQAASTFHRALAIVEAHFGSDHPFYPILLRNYSGYRRHIGNTRGAKAIAAQSQRLLRDNARRNGIGETIDVSAFGH